MNTLFDQEIDVFALVKNQRPSKNSIYNGYRPAFMIKEDYLTSGEIQFKNIKELKYGEETIAEIRFFTPEYYPNCLSCAQILPFYEGEKLQGYAKIISICNKFLEKSK